MRFVKVGTVGVDSGQVLVVDPGMAKYVEGTEAYVKPSEVPGKQIEFPGCVSMDTQGDGDYPVYAMYNEEGEYIGFMMLWELPDAFFTLTIIEEEE